MAKSVELHGVDGLMTDPVLKLATQGKNEFVITLPGTSYQMTFRKLADFPG
jgi:hypothetical protein